MTEPARTSTATRTASWPPTWPPVPDRAPGPCRRPGETPGIAESSTHPAAHDGAGPRMYSRGSMIIGGMPAPRNVGTETRFKNYQHRQIAESVHAAAIASRRLLAYIFTRSGGFPRLRRRDEPPARHAGRLGQPFGVHRGRQIRAVVSSRAADCSPSSSRLPAWKAAKVSVRGWSSLRTWRSWVRVSSASSRARCRSPNSRKSLARRSAVPRVWGWSSPRTRRRTASVCSFSSLAAWTSPSSCQQPARLWAETSVFRSSSPCKRRCRARLSS